MTRTLVLAAAAAVLPLSAARADAPPPTPKAVAALERLVGTWKVSGSITMATSGGKQKAPIAGSLGCARTAGGVAVLCTFHVTGIPGAPPLEETDLFAWEPNTDKLHWFAATNFGETHDHVAQKSTGDKLEFTYAGTMEGKPLKETIVMTFAKDGSIAGASETTVGGASVATLAFEVRK